FQEHVVAHGAVALGRELEIVVVVRVLQARAFGLLTETIGERCRSVRLIQTHARRRRALEQPRAQTSARGILRTERVRLLEQLAGLAGVEWQVGTRAPEACIIEKPAKLLRRQLAKPRGLYLAETDLPDGSKRRRGVCLQSVLHGVKL